MIRQFESNDMAKIDCHDCKGCFACCHDMGESIIVDPMDAYRLTKNLHKSFEELLSSGISLHVEDGLILPHMAMKAPENKCFFLDKEGRCSIHAFRPGLCRAFPLGRNYEAGKLTYFILEGACPKENKSKQKIGKWLDYEDAKKSEEFLVSWHYLIKEIKEEIINGTISKESLKDFNMQLLQTFYFTSYDFQTDFFSQFKNRSEKFADIRRRNYE